MKKTTLILLFGIINNVFAQVNIEDQVDVSNFPSIQFTIHNRNPVILPKSAFLFKEFIDGEKIESGPFEINSLIKDTIDYSKENKCVLILLEFSHHKDRQEQVYTFKKAIEESLNDVVNKGDKFKIVTFSLKNGKTKILKNVNEYFTDSISLLTEALTNFKIKRNDFTNKYVSDIYGGIIEAVDELDDYNSNLKKSILLLSEERNNSKIINRSEIAFYKANKKGIVINSIKYNRSRYHQFADPNIAKSTYGLSKVLKVSSGNLDRVNYEKKEESKEFIISTLNNVVERSKGVTYSISLQLKNKIKDGENHLIEIKIDDTDEIKKLNYKAPGNWIIAQFQINLYIAITVSISLLLIFTYLIYYLLKRSKLKKNEQVKERIRLDEKEQLQQSQIKAQDEELLKIKNKEDQRKQSEKEEFIKKTENDLIKQMSSNGSFPILKFSDASSSKTFEINKPNISVGRDKSSNSICIPNNNMSRNHFSIVFLNNDYKVLDNKSTNGVRVNGRKTEEALLQDGDIIEIAELTFTFYK